MPKRTHVIVRLAATLGAALVALSAVPSAHAYRLEGGRWPTRTITYYNEVPAYSWAVDTAAYAWNTSGARVQFLKMPRRAAKVLVGVRWFKVAGDANVQRLKDGRFIGAQVGIRTGQDRYTMALVVAHEFGHVLGLDHEDRVCATMNTYLVDNHPEYCPAPEGKWICRLLRTDDIRGAIRLYGGSVRPLRGSEFCPR
jgi:hypothetical protein